MQTSFKKMFSADYLVMMSTLTPIISGVIFVDSISSKFLFKLLGENSSDNRGFTLFLGLFVLSVAIFIPLLIIRIKQIRDILENGQIVKATITHLKLYKDRGRVEYDYSIAGNKLHAGNALHRNQYVESLKVGDQVEVVVSKKQSNKALLKTLFVE